MEVRNDTPVYHVLDGGPWSGTREAICAKGLEIDPHWQCRGYCPHQWLGQDGFIDPELTRNPARAGFWANDVQSNRT